MMERRWFCSVFQSCRRKNILSFAAADPLNQDVLECGCDADVIVKENGVITKAKGDHVVYAGLLRV